MDRPLYVVMECAAELVPRVRYTLDTLLMAAGVRVVYASEPPTSGVWLLYGSSRRTGWPMDRCLSVRHCPEAWSAIRADSIPTKISAVGGLPCAFAGGLGATGTGGEIAFDLPANAFFFLASCSERSCTGSGDQRSLFAGSIFSNRGIPQNIVDLYLKCLRDDLERLCARYDVPAWKRPLWPDGHPFAVVLSHDVDFVPGGGTDVARQAAKTFLRHLVREGAPLEAFRAMKGFVRAVARKRDAYGCIPEIITGERALGVKSSFQVAVARRHPLDVNYDVTDRRTRQYLSVIPSAGFDLCLHGSYRSTERSDWYKDEVEILTRQLGRPRGSRQHFLSFDYDSLFGTQERTSVEFDMSMGYPDRTGPRTGFSYPYFPYCLAEDRPYDVVEIGLVLMDVTLRSYMGMRAEQAWEEIQRQVDGLASVNGCGSVVWHPIVFGGARDPGYDELYWRLVRYVSEHGGLATDGVTINNCWRELAADYASFVDCRRLERASAEL